MVADTYGATRSTAEMQNGMIHGVLFVCVIFEHQKIVPNILYRPILNEIVQTSLGLYQLLGLPIKTRISEFTSILYYEPCKYNLNRQYCCVKPVSVYLLSNQLLSIDFAKQYDMLLIKTTSCHVFVDVNLAFNVVSRSC